MRQRVKARFGHGAAAAVLGLALATTSSAVDDPNAYTTSDFYISSIDGTQLHTVLFRPLHPPEKTPVILEVTPYLTSGATPLSPTDAVAGVGYGPGSLGSAGRIFEKGYSYAVVALRGFGASGGCYDFGGPGEQMDVVAAVKWAASQPWSSGKVGMTGTSYPGGTQVMALAAHEAGFLGDELAAVVPKSPPTGFLNLYTAYVNPVRNTGGGHGLAAFYLASDLLPPSIQDTPEHQLSALGGSAANPACYPEGVIASPSQDVAYPTGALGSLSDDLSAPYWVEREVGKRAAGTTVPTLWVQGFSDWQVRPPNAFAVYPTLRGPHRGFFGPWDHGIATPNDEHAFVHEAVRWYDRWVKGDTTVDTGPTVLVQDPSGGWRAEEEWPPPDAVRHDLPLLDATFLDTAGNFSETGFPQVFPVEPPVPLPGGNGSWTFTQALPYDVHLAGFPTLTATVDSLVPNVHVVVLVYDVDGSGNAAFVDRGVTRVPAAGTITFDLYPQDWTIAAGHRIGVLVGGADDVWFEPGTSATPVTVRQATLSLPALPSRRPALVHGPFLPRAQHAPFAVDVSGRTVEWTDVPPEMTP